MTETKNDLTLEAPIPAASLESILCTEELQRRPSRPPDYEKENRALVALASALADSPSTIFQILAETIHDITQCDSAGLSLLTKDGKTPHVDGQRFYWPAICGMWSPHVGGGTPRNFGPCGDVLDRNRTLLFRHFERRYPYLIPVNPAAEECLLVPFYIAGKAVGTIWAIMHSDRRRFDAEDDRIMASLGKFASSAYQAWMQIENLKIEVAEREKAEAELRKLTDVLETQVRARTQELTRSEAYLAKAQALSHTGSFGWHVASGRLYWSDETYRILELESTAEPTLERVFERTHPEDKQLVQDVIDEAARDRKDFDFEHRILTANGSVKFLRVVGHATNIESSDFEFLGAVTDITDRKRAEDELRRSEAFLAEAQSLSSIGSFSWRVETDDITWSDELYRIYELEIGVPVTLDLIRTRVHPEDISLIEKMKVVDQNGKVGDDFEWHWRLMMPDHSIKYLHAVAHATRDQNGQVEYIAAVQDVTARRLAEEARDKARSKLAHVARVMSLGTLAASIAHELNQPLSGIVTNASTCQRMLAAAPPNVDGALETARRTIRDANRASDVIARLRALFSRKETATESVDLNEAAREVIALSLSGLQRNKIVVREELADDLPPVIGDRIQLQQVILNLLRNGSEAMSTVDDHPRQLVVATGREEGDRVRLSIKDVGVGFEPQAAGRLFEDFYTTKTDGMGIGLSVSRSIIESHHGHLWAKKNDGPGATFSFSIPCRRKQGLTSNQTSLANRMASGRDAA